MLLSGGVVALTAAPAAAADMNDFDPGMIISDEVFYDSGTMTAAQVQAFLDDKGSGCVPSSEGLPCLKDYTETTPDRAATDQCAAYVGAENESAAQIIWKSAQACGVNPQALIVILQKEQGLVTVSGDSIVESRYRSAMGFRCPTFGECEPQYAGFSNQVYSAASRFQYYADHPTWFNFQAGEANTIQYHPNTACGSSEVFIRNQATAGLYNYTPYQPNAAALAAGYGVGDSCSAYGNRNFWGKFTDWFGSTGAVNHTPFGELESVVAGSRSVSLTGWAIDPDTTSSIYIWVTVDGVGRHVLANQARSDVAYQYPEYGAAHGFAASIDVGGGSHRVCATASNVGLGSHRSLGCETVSTGGSPFGQLESVVGGTGAVELTGWAIDPDTTDSIYIWVTIDGVGRHILANRTRSDVAAEHPDFGAAHGFAASLPVSVGSHRVCATASNVHDGSHTSLGCTTAATGGSPVGNFERASAAASGISIKGWALDPDRVEPIFLWVTVDGAGRHVYANRERADVGQAYPAYGSGHGFEATISVGSGSHKVCVTASNVGVGGHTSLGCRTVTYEPSGNRSPFGNLERVAANANGIEIKGWAIDPDTSDPVFLWVTVDGAGQHVYANVERADVGRAYPD